VEPFAIAKKKGATLLAMTNVLGSTMYRMADKKLMLQAGPEKAVAGTKSFTAMVANMVLLAYAVAGDAKTGAEILEKSAVEIERILQKTDSIKELAEKIYEHDHIYILGRGLSYPLALEAALKIKEISYIHAEGFAGGELKHGVIALVEKGTPVMVFVPNDETKSAILASAMEVKARGAFVIGVGDEENPVFDYFFKVEDVGASSLIPHVVFPQLLSYYLTVKLGLNPDKPRNLAKSVVVK
jgi:glucosamine--fructose-6-phosphate aminotransferase (isomerizing)